MESHEPEGLCRVLELKGLKKIWRAKPMRSHSNRVSSAGQGPLFLSRCMGASRLPSAPIGISLKTNDICAVRKNVMLGYMLAFSAVLARRA